MEFIKKNWKIILFGLLGLAIGFGLQVYANHRSEQRIIDALITEIKTLKDKQQITRTTPEEQKRLIELEAQLQLMTS